MSDATAAESSAETDGPLVLVETPARRPDSDDELPGVALVTLNRRRLMNALSFALLDELASRLEALDAEPACRCIVLTGAGSKAFASGADIDELRDQTPVSLETTNSFRHWGRIGRVRTPIVAAVRGYALGGGCELAMSCDMIVAGDDARFGQPEIRLGVMPGAGGTQRLARAVGKARAMELILTGRLMPAAEAAAAGLVTRVVPAEETLSAALDLAAQIASMAPLAVMAAKQAINRAFELPLSAGLEHERQLFYLLFATEDQAEGMAAFLAKRRPAWRGR